MKKKPIPEARAGRVPGSEQDPLTRREMIANSALAGAALAGLATAGASLIPVSAIQAAQATAAAKPATAFPPTLRKVLDVLVDRIIPRDENGPGALDADAAEYIDRAFVDFLRAEKGSFGVGLGFLESYASASQGAPFTELSEEKRDAVLTAVEAGEADKTHPNLRQFFARARRLTLEGMFCDPYWGGNKNFVGWDLIRYPGVRLMVTADDQKMSAPAKAVHKGAYDSGDTHGH